MSENNFSNNEPENEGVLGQNQAETAVQDRIENQPRQEAPIQSKDYSEIKPLYTSRYGNSPTRMRTPAWRSTC